MEIKKIDIDVAHKHNTPVLFFLKNIFHWKTTHENKKKILYDIDIAHMNTTLKTAFFLKTYLTC
jgi:hypothetical protein